MKILFVQEIPEIRSIKTALALKEKNIRVDCLYLAGDTKSRNKINQTVFNQEYTVNINTISKKCSEYDLVHFHNSPDRGFLLCLESNKPVIWDCHDPVSLFDEIEDPRGNDKIIERHCYIKSSGNIFASDGFKNYCEQQYGKKEDNVVLENYPSKWMIKSRKNKINDNKIHVVYAGSISEKENSHRFFENEFRLIVENPNHLLHIYPAATPKTQKHLKNSQVDFMSFCIQHPQIIIHDPVSIENLIPEISQYDYGLIPFSETHRFCHYFTPNKLYEYNAAGLKILTKKFKHIEEPTKEWKNIKFVKDFSNLKLDKVEIPSGNITYFEDQIDKCINLYKKILK